MSSFCRRPERGVEFFVTYRLSCNKPCQHGAGSLSASSIYGLNGGNQAIHSTSSVWKRAWGLLPPRGSRTSTIPRGSLKSKSTAQDCDAMRSQRSCLLSIFLPQSSCALLRRHENAVLEDPGRGRENNLVAVPRRTNLASGLGSCEDPGN